MRRSEVNQLLEEAKRFFAAHQFPLPPWGYWPLATWRQRQAECAAIFTHHLGWDVTDFGSGDFPRRGLLLFTLRNGQLGADRKPYAEKIMLVRENQETPWHYHQHKMEDIINRGGGQLVLELARSTADGWLRDTPVTVDIDGIPRQVARREQVVLEAGESICLEPGVYHRFFGQPGRGLVLVGEVSMVNDDATDNYFLDRIGRFPALEEDAQPVHPLVCDYAKFLQTR